MVTLLKSLTTLLSHINFNSFSTIVTIVVTLLTLIIGLLYAFVGNQPPPNRSRRSSSSRASPRRGEFPYSPPPASPPVDPGITQSSSTEYPPVFEPTQTTVRYLVDGDRVRLRGFNATDILGSSRTTRSVSENTIFIVRIPPANEDTTAIGLMEESTEYYMGGVPESWPKQVPNSGLYIIGYGGRGINTNILVVDPNGTGVPNTQIKANQPYYLSAHYRDSAGIRRIFGAQNYSLANPMTTTYREGDSYYTRNLSNAGPPLTIELAN